MVYARIFFKNKNQLLYIVSNSLLLHVNLKLSSCLKYCNEAGLKWKFPCFLLLSLISLSISTHAQMAENLFIGNAKATALANAVTADPPGIDSINFNPAGLAKVRTGNTGWNREVKLIGIADVTMEGTISTPENDPYADQYLNVNGCVNQCLLGEDPTADSTTKMDKFQTYIPGYGKAGVNLPTIVPNVGFAYRPHEKSKFTLATTAMAPFSLGLLRSPDDPGVYAGRDVAMGRYIYFAPSVAYEINEQWTVGATFAASMMGMFMGLDMRLPNLAIGAFNTLINDLCEGIEDNELCLEGGDPFDPYSSMAVADIEMDDYFAPSFHLGVLYEPTAWFSWGMLYRHSTTHKMEGSYEITTSESLAEFTRAANELSGGIGPLLGLPEGISGVQRGSASMELTFPRHIATGVSIKITPQWKFNLDYKWSEYGIWDSWDIRFDDPHDLSGVLALSFPTAPENTLPFERGYKNTGNWAYGLTYTYSDRLELRGGYEFRPDVAPKNRRDLLIPISDMDIYGLGFFYRWDNSTDLEFTIAHVASESKIGANESTFTSTNPAEVFALYPGLDIDTELKITMIQINWSKAY